MYNDIRNLVEVIIFVSFILLVVGGIFYFLHRDVQSAVAIQKNSEEEEIKWLEEAPVGSQFNPSYVRSKNYALTHGWKVIKIIDNWGGESVFIEKVVDPKVQIEIKVEDE